MQNERETSVFSSPPTVAPLFGVFKTAHKVVDLYHIDKQVSEHTAKGSKIFICRKKHQIAGNSILLLQEPVDQKKYIIKVIPIPNEQQYQHTMNEIQMIHNYISLKEEFHSYFVVYYNCFEVYKPYNENHNPTKKERSTVISQLLSPNSSSSTTTTTPVSTASSGSGYLSSSPEAEETAFAFGGEHDAGLQFPRKMVIEMEYCEKGNLVDFIKSDMQSQPFPLHDLMSIMLKLSEIIYVLHYKFNWMHRDLKLENVLVTADNQVKLGDFDLVKPMTASSLVNMTHCIGTFSTIAPEVMEENAYYDYSADMFSLGCCFLRLITFENRIVFRLILNNERAFKQSIKSKIEQYLNGQPQHCQTARFGFLKKPLCHLLCSLLSLNHVNRFTAFQNLHFVGYLNLLVVSNTTSAVAFPKKSYLGNQYFDDGAVNGLPLAPMSPPLHHSTGNSFQLTSPTPTSSATLSPSHSPHSGVFNPFETFLSSSDSAQSLTTLLKLENKLDDALLLCNWKLLYHSYLKSLQQQSTQFKLGLILEEHPILHDQHTLSSLLSGIKWKKYGLYRSHFQVGHLVVKWARDSMLHFSSLEQQDERVKMIIPLYSFDASVDQKWITTISEQLLIPTIAPPTTSTSAPSSSPKSTNIASSMLLPFLKTLGASPSTTTTYSLLSPPPSSTMNHSNSNSNASSPSSSSSTTTTTTTTTSSPSSFFTKSSLKEVAKKLSEYYLMKQYHSVHVRSETFADDLFKCFTAPTFDYNQKVKHWLAHFVQNGFSTKFHVQWNGIQHTFATHQELDLFVIQYAQQLDVETLQLLKIFDRSFWMNYLYYTSKRVPTQGANKEKKAAIYAPLQDTKNHTTNATAETTNEVGVIATLIQRGSQISIALEDATGSSSTSSGDIGRRRSIGVITSSPRHHHHSDHYCPFKHPYDCGDFSIPS